MTDSNRRIPKTLGERIAQARREKGVREHRDITRVDVAEAVGVVPSAVTFWETDEKSPREDTLAKVADYLGVTPAYLRYGVTEGGAVSPAAAAGYVPRPLPPDRIEKETRDRQPTKGRKRRSS